MVKHWRKRGQTNDDFDDDFVDVNLTDSDDEIITTTNSHSNPIITELNKIISKDKIPSSSSSSPTKTVSPTETPPLQKQHSHKLPISLVPPSATTVKSLKKSKTPKKKYLARKIEK